MTFVYLQSWRRSALVGATVVALGTLAAMLFLRQQRRALARDMPRLGGIYESALADDSPDDNSDPADGGPDASGPVKPTAMVVGTASQVTAAGDSQEHEKVRKQCQRVVPASCHTSLLCEQGAT